MHRRCSIAGCIKVARSDRDRSGGWHHTRGLVQPSQERAAKNGPASLTARETGASFSKDKCVLISL